MTTTASLFSRRLLSSAAVLALALGVTACGGQGESSSASTASAFPSESAATGLKVEQSWAKAADSGMSAAFGKLTNTTDHEITVVSASSRASKSVQLHETVTDQNGSSRMQEKDGGFVLEPGKSLELKPGGNHIMLMDLMCSLKAGDDVEVTVRTEDGQKTSFDAPIRDYSAAQEHYDASARPSVESTASAQGMDGSGSGRDGMKGMDMSSSSASALPECHG